MNGDGVNLAGLLTSSASRLPDKPALLHRGQAVTYLELDDRAARAAGALRALGLAAAGDGSPGDRVALMVGNTPAFAEALFGILRAGLVAVPLNVAFTRDEVAHILADASARAIVVAEPFLPALDDVGAAVEHLIVVGAGQPPAGALDWRDLLHGAEPADTVAAGEDSLALLQYTSGTTGKPKGAMLGHRHLLANQRQMAETKLKLDERDIVLCVLPLFHIYALNVVLAYGLASGATLLLLERFDPVETLREAERHRATVLVGAPPMYVAWVSTEGLENLDLDAVRYAVSGAAALPADVLERFTARLGVPLWEGYGLTETSPVLTTTAMGEEPKPGSVGRPLPGVEARLVDDGAPVRRGDPGEVVVRGPNVFAGYWRDAEATQAVLDRDGWFRTGDIGYTDDEGDLHLVDRKTDLIIVSGFNVYPREVEDVLVRHPKVAQAAVVGAAHPASGECVQAFVALVDGAEATGEEITEFARRHLARFKVPESVEIVGELPLLPSGKIRRRSLKAPGRPAGR